MIDKKICVEIYLSILGYHFMKLDKNPTSSHESKIHRTLRKIKSKLSTEEYRKLYTTGSYARRFCGITEVYKIDRNDKVDKLPLRQIISNIDRASCQLVKYFAKLFSSLSKNEYTVQSFTETVPHGYHLISFDVIFFFTNVPLDATIDIVLRRI